MQMIQPTTGGRHGAPKNLGELVDHLQSVGIYAFTKAEAVSSLGSHGTATDAAARVLRSKGKLAMPRRGLYVIVPAEYRAAGAPPPTWYVHALMGFQERPYYVGLLSAAELHGAAHHRPQQFQIVTDAPLRPIRVGRSALAFFVKRQVAQTPVDEVKTPTGSMRVSSPEATAFDLVRYVDAAGQLDNVATVLAELSEKLRARRLVAAAKAGVELSVVQRCGYLLDLVGAGALTNGLAAWVAEQRPRPTPLRPDRRPDRLGGGSLDARWKVVVNDQVEPDL